ncbi:hypothetical protein L7F22_017451 [Adiantum nelumboides]|nr:hypothetical protein [Adiantum nelumboides]
MSEDVVYKRRKQVDYNSMDAAKLVKECLSEDFADARQAWEGQETTTEVVIPVQYLMDPVAQYALNAVILFFPGKMPSAQDVGQWVDYLLKKQAVRGVYFGARGFYEVLLADIDARSQLQGSSRLDAGGGGNMQDYLTTTNNFIGLAPRVIVPMHGHISLWPLQMLRGYVRYREAREAKIQSCINQGARTAFEVVSQAYSDTPPALWMAALSNAKLHVDHLDQLQQLPQDFSRAVFQNSCGVGFLLRCLSYSSLTRLSAVCHSHHDAWKVPVAIAVLGCVCFLWLR